MNESPNSVNVLEPPSTLAQPERRSAPPPAASLSPVGAALAWFRRTVPILLVLAALGGLAYLGHHTGWTVPKFDDLFGNGQAAKDDWCKEHAVPESACVECNESLMPRGKSVWCRKHGVFNCPFENPDVAQLKTKPQIDPADLERAQRALELKDRPENSPKCKLHHRRLQFASEEVVNKMGVDIGVVWRAPMEDTVSASGEIAYAQPLVAPLSSPVSGRAWEVTDKGQLGAAVKKGDVLALVDAVEVGKAKAEFLQALAQVELKAKAVERLRPLSGTKQVRKTFFTRQTSTRNPLSTPQRYATPPRPTGFPSTR